MNVFTDGQDDSKYPDAPELLLSEVVIGITYRGML